MLSYTNAVIALIVIAGIALLGSAILTLGETPEKIELQKPALQNTPENFQQFASAELEDKCAVPPGQDPEKWKEHLGHHPDLYAECL
ncbi:MAG: hypothetical protein COV47_03855 [Candidatus Diapherotrites archaeon CG11_big_fil_rev_8_21_14_0_20_37_9]|nr:MAG: hypothetical protein COV47_03855 [Candidatus Diapherotrites archaeon CG11_big_fil_rev_8_21_14_0_20_37_9]